MSYYVDFCDPVSEEVIVIEEPHFMQGGTHVVGGTKELSLNVTYNYAKNYAPHGFNIYDSLNGKTALEVIPELDRVIGLLSDETSPDYWEPVGPAKRALIQLRTMAKMCPDAVIKVNQ